MLLIRLLMVVGLVLLVLWLWRGSRRGGARPGDVRPGGAQPPQATGPQGVAAEAMQVCAYCGVHVPRSEAVTGAHGVYCSEAHRAASGAQHP